MTRVTRESPISGKIVSMYIETTEEKVAQWDKLGRKPGTPHVQEFFPELNAQQREFVLTGIPPNEWEEIFGEEEE